MGVVKMPALSDYWSDRLRYPLMADVMPVKRFKKLRRLVHFTSTEDATDKFTKIRPAFGLLRGNFRKVEEEKQQSIDEMMVPYKGKRAGKLRQYMKNKPHKWGYKLFCGGGGPQSWRKAVVYLCSTLQNPEESAVFFDNFFCSIELIKYLKETFGTVSLDTIQSPRMRGCPLLEDKALLKKGRGHYDQKTEKTSGVTIIKWVDNKVVNLASNFVGVQPEGTVKRFSKEESKKVAVPCPRIVLEYNNHMGGVDLADMLIELYRTPLKSKRFEVVCTVA
ncbi:piggyBac transposable element-derived protein 3-like [Ixodes scapularis]|uniref:piggyBac transposable element-derived protein 3-like n=1 Tax=Ixodes scapularis TaxID=6945 RepID=UPI001C39293B|nr:piggyBac transposable element-derived protein 3-like [Ixodes scapularis]